MSRQYDDENEDTRTVRIQAPSPGRVLRWIFRFIFYVLLVRFGIFLVLAAIFFGGLVAVSKWQGNNIKKCGRAECSVGYEAPPGFPRP